MGQTRLSPDFHPQDSNLCPMWNQKSVSFKSGLHTVITHWHHSLRNKRTFFNPKHDLFFWTKPSSFVCLNLTAAVSQHWASVRMCFSCTSHTYTYTKWCPLRHYYTPRGVTKRWGWEQVGVFWTSALLWVRQLNWRAVLNHWSGPLTNNKWFSNFFSPWVSPLSLLYIQVGAVCSLQVGLGAKETLLTPLHVLELKKKCNQMFDSHEKTLQLNISQGWGRREQFSLSLNCKSS